MVSDASEARRLWVTQPNGFRPVDDWSTGFGSVKMNGIDYVVLRLGLSKYVLAVPALDAILNAPEHQVLEFAL